MVVDEKQTMDTTNLHIGGEKMFIVFKRNSLKRKLLAKEDIISEDNNKNKNNQNIHDVRVREQLTIRLHREPLCVSSKEQ